MVDLLWGVIVGSDLWWVFWAVAGGGLRCLNFKGRVTVASVKNFQLVHQNVSVAEQEKVTLQ